MDWHDDGVTVAVDVSTTGQFITPTPTTQLPFSSGGDRGQPSGWTAYQENYASPIWSQVQFSVNSNGEFSINSTSTNNRKDVPFGAYLFYPVTPGHVYLVMVDVKGKETFQPNFSGPKLVVDRWVGTTTFRQSIAAVQFFRDGVPDVTNYQTLGVQQTMAADENYLKISLAACNGQRSPYDSASPDYGVMFTSLLVLDVTPVLEMPDFGWKTVVCDTMDASIRYGRARFTERYNVGTFSIKLNNISGDYTYNDQHPFGFRPGRLVKLTATHKGQTYALAFGVIDRIETTIALDGKASVLLTVFDPTSFTSDIRTPGVVMQSAGSLNPFLSGSRINLLLNYVGVPSVFRTIDAGQWGMQQVMPSNRAVREEVGVTCDSEGGSFFAERDGKLTYKDRTWSTVDPNGNSVQAQITAYPNGLIIDPQPDETPTDPNAAIICPFSIEPDWSLERVINYIRVGTAGGSPYVFENKPSQQEHGVRTHQRLDFLNAEPGQSVKPRLQQRAADIFSTSLEALLRVERLSFRPSAQHDSNAWEFTLTVFLNWLVRVFYYNPSGDWGFSTVVRVQSINHQISPTDWVVSIDVDQPISFNDTLNPLPPGGWDIGLWDVNLWDEPAGEFVPGSGAYWNSGQTWNGDGTKWLGRGWSSGISKWSNPDDDWKN